MAQKTILTDTPKNLIFKFSKALKHEKIPVKEIILYGSYAKGHPKPCSDLDICVVSPVFGKNVYDEIVRLMHISGTIDPMIEPYPYHPDDLNNPFDPLAFEIRTYGKVF